MRTYIVVEGNQDNIRDFELKVAQALDEGYMLAGSLIACPTQESVYLYQPLILEDRFIDEDEINNDEIEELEPRL